jgi:putative transposase
MRCTKEDFVSGAIFHIYNHAIDDYLLFYDDQDYEFFLYAFKKQYVKIPSSIFAYCLMPNHYHFLIRQDSEKKIYKIFNYSFISYAQYFNKKYGRKGPIFRTPMHHKKVESKEYLIQLCKYIHMNPVYADLVNNPENWIYSNYLEWIKQRDGVLFCPDIHTDLFPEPEEYACYIESFENYLSIKSFKKLLLDNP